MIPAYPKFVKALIKPGAHIIKTIDPFQMNCLHMAVGISGEAGEVLELIKKSSLHNKDVPIERVIDELGDLEFYMEGLRQALSITREECIEANVKKLSKRYEQLTYSDAAAAARKDEAK